MTERAVYPCVIVLALALLPPPAGGDTWNVSNVSQFNDAVGRANPYDEIVLAAGDYYLTRPLEIWDHHLTIRGATGQRDDVQLIGSGMNVSGVNEGLCFSADYVAVRDLTLRDFYHNALHIRAERDADGIVISNVKTWNIGQRHVKGSGGGTAAAISDDVVIENLYMLQTEPRADGNHHGDYIGGIDAMGCRNWVIRDCVAEGIRGHVVEGQAGGNAAIFLWQGIQGVTIERNTIIDCAKGIALGNPSGPDPDDATWPWHAVDVLIRNNMVRRGPWTTGNNIALELCNTKDVRVLGNTFYSPNASYFRTISPFDAIGEGLTTNLEFANNIVRGGVRDFTVSGDYGADDLRAMGNIIDESGTLVTPAWFVDEAGGDFHLTLAAEVARDTGTVLAEVPADFDLVARGLRPDYGADEFQFPGDADTDGVVDLFDLAALANHYQAVGAGWNGGDFDGDGVTDVLDLSILANAYGADTHAGGESQAVPEPVTVILFAAGASALLARRRRRSAPAFVRV